MAPHSTFEQQKPTVAWRLEKIVRRLTEPAPSNREVEQRFQARLLASLLIVFIFLGFLATTVQLITVPGFERIFPTLLASLLILLFAYVLSRTRYYKLGALITVAIPAIAVFVNVSIDPDNTGTFFYVIISVLLSSILLSWRWTAVLVVSIPLVMLLLSLVIPAMKLADVVAPSVFSILASGLILVIMRYRDLLETSRQAELALSENRWRMLIHQSPFSTVIYSPEGRLQNFNQAALELWNLSAKDLESLQAEYNILEDSQLEAKGALPYIKRSFAGAAATAPPTKYEFLRTNENGLKVVDQRWIKTHCYPVKDDAGNLYEVVLIHEDITQRKEAEEALRRSENYFRSLIENISDIVTILDVDGTIRFESPAIERVLGYKPDELIGKNVFDFVHVDDLSYAQEILAERIKLAGPTPPIELRFKHKDGSWRVLEVFGNNLLNEPDVAGVVINSRDITKRKRGEAALRESETRLAEAQRMAHVGSWEWVAEGDTLVWSKELYAILGIDPTEPPLTLNEQQKLYTHESAERMREATELTIKDGVPYEIELERVRKDKTRQWLLAHGEPWLDENGHFKGLRGTTLDITERKQAEEMIRRQDRLAAVGQLAAGIAHDFNNIMAVIMLYSELLLKSSHLNKKEQRQLQTIWHQANRAADLTVQVLDFSRQSVMEQKPVDLVPFLKELKKLVERTFPEHVNVNIACRTESCMVHADITRLQQVIMNLALNARDALPDGGELSFELDEILAQTGESSLLTDKKGGKWAKITVSDNGIGMSGEVLAHLFEPFFTTKPRGQGTGLGLAQVYGIVKQHDGYIDVESQPGQGTTFIIYLPAISEAQLAVQPPVSEELITGKGETILVVEDDPMTRAALAEGLVSLNYQVLMATNGRKALDILDEQGDEIALILSDVVMPEMGGLELLQALKQRGINVPVVMVTGHPLGETLEALRAEGLREWLLKPPPLEKLARAVATLLHEA